MTPRPPEITRAFSAEYLAREGRYITRVFDGPFREYVCADYVSWLEQELKKEREK